MKFKLLTVAVMAALFSASCTHMRDRTASRTAEPAMAAAPSSGQMSDQRAGLGTGGAGGSGGAVSSRY